MTALYMGTIVLKAWFPRKEQIYQFADHEKDPGWKMKLPIILLACIIVCLGVFSGPLLNIIKNVAYGVF